VSRGCQEDEVPAEEQRQRDLW